MIKFDSLRNHLRFLLVLVLGLTFSSARAQFTMTNSYNGHSSDYYIYFTWANVPTGNFSCGADDNVDIFVGSTGYGSTDVINLGSAISGATQRAAGSVTVGYRPGISETVYLNLNYHGRSGPNSGCASCCTFSCSTCSSADNHNDQQRTFSLNMPQIYPPINGAYNIINTSNIPNAQFTKLFWGAGTDVPLANHQYLIYRNGVLLDTVSSSTFQWIDSALLPSATYTYTVRTQATSWGNPVSVPLTISVPIHNDLLQATDATVYGKSQLTWPNMAVYAPNDINVLRDGQQVAVVNKNATTYNDFDGVPGVVYDYSVAPINANNQSPFAFHDNGASRPNGVIKGNIRTPFSAAVPGVTMYAYASINGTLFYDSTVSDASGFYQFGDRFYDTAAVYTIVPHKGTHKFNPDTLTRRLDQNNNNISGVDFQDTSVFTIKGQVKFSPDPHCPNCYAGGVAIYQNGTNTNVTTDANGNYSLAIQQEGTYTFKPVLYNHKFFPDSVVINVTTDSFGVNFTDKATDTIYISLKGGCQNQVAHHAIISVNADNGSYAAFDTFSGYGQAYVVVPAQAYTINFIKGFSNSVFEDPLIAGQLGSSPIAVDATKRDSSTLTHIDTTYTVMPPVHDTLISGQIVIHPAHTDTLIDTLNTQIELRHRADFVYHGQITVDVINFPISSECPTVNNGYILDQANPVKLRVSIKEFYQYDSTSCPVDSGQLVIYDDVSDAGGAQTVNFYNGLYEYTVVPGSPNIAAPYLKVLQFFAHVGSITNPTWGKQILVTGHKPHTQTFVTKTPELPFFVLHDPPGDASYSFLERDSSVSYNYSNSYQTGGSAGPYIDAKIGAGVPIPFTGVVIGAGTEIQADATAGRDNNHNTDVTTSFTASQQFSTSSSSDFVGGEGDVFVGGSFNMIYALTDVIELKNCTVVRDTQLAWGANGLATNYIYTEKHIRETLIPQLQNLKNLSHGDTIAQIQSYIDVWNQVLSKNRRSRDTAAAFVQNVSFSAGAPYDNSTSSSSDSTESYDYSVYLDVNAGIGVFFGDLGGFANTSLGVKANFHWNTDKSTSTNVNMNKTIGYHLEDSNPGDFMSVDVKTDNVYGTPSFSIVAGTSSCPHEVGTQARDSANISLASYSVSNVPLNQSANFVAHIVNLSESQETRTYNVQAVPESNLDGAIIKIGGQQINNSPAAFTVPAGTDLPVVLTVDRGPIASDYNGLQVSVSSPCDGGEGNTLTFEAHFQSTCSPIGLYSPSDNWLINGGNHDSLLVIFSGYNATDSNLISIGLEYRQPGGSWIPATNPPIAKSALTSAYYNFVFNTASLPDGDYEIRAYANCGSQPGGKTYSATLSGKVDRSSLQLFGTPSPSDGVLNVTQNISVSFNGAVDCGQAAAYTPIYSTLVRADNGQVIPDSVTCNGNQLIIYTNPPSLIDSLENVTLTATINNVYDLNGNSLQNPIVWSFVVSRSKVYWSPSNLNMNAVTGATATATATMSNVGPLDTFTIVHMPSWLTTPQSPFYIINPGTPTTPSTIPVTFTALNSLNPGHYSDTVIATANGKQLFLFVNLDVVKPHPNWSVNPANYQYTMNVTTNFSLTQLNAPLSTDTRDTIAVFKGEECRGYAGISYDPYTNKYVAFLTAYSNSVVGDTFTFRVWDAMPGTEYQAKERLAFIYDGNIGQPLAPYILHPEGVFQTLTFIPGWNWFSLNVANSDMTPKNVLSHLHPNNGATVKTSNSYTQYTTANQSWQGSLTTFGTDKSYQIQLDHADTIHFLGQLITANTVMAIAPGWNWIGYPRQNISTASSYLATTNPANGDLLKTQSVFTQYNGGGWSGALNNMYPGQGYKLKSSNAYNFVVAPERSIPSWNADEHQYQQNQSVTAELQFDGVPTTQSHYLVGAFTANNVCVGIGQPIYIAALNVYRVFLTIHGDTANASQAISFHVYDTDNDVDYTPIYDPISITPDTAVARIESPYVINVQTATGINAINFTEGYSLLQNVPNPFSKNTSIDYVVPTAQQVSLTLYDESGRLVAELVNGTQAVGKHSVSFVQENLQSGVYFYQMKSGDFVKTRRMLIIK